MPPVWLSAFGVAFSPNAKIAGQVTANVHAQGPTEPSRPQRQRQWPQPGITGKDIPQPVKVPAIEPGDDAAANPVQQLHRDFWRDLAGRADDVAQYTGASPNVDATIKTINGKVNELLNIAQAYGVSAAEGMSGSGNITLDVHATARSRTRMP